MAENIDGCTPLSEFPLVPCVNLGEKESGERLEVWCQSNLQWCKLRQDFIKDISQIETVYGSWGAEESNLASSLFF
jgi:hypothetical protein